MSTLEQFIPNLTLSQKKTDRDVSEEGRKLRGQVSLLMSS